MAGHLKLRIVDQPVVDQASNTFSVTLAPKDEPGEPRKVEREHLFLSGSISLLESFDGTPAKKEDVEKIAHALARVFRHVGDGRSKELKKRVGITWERLGTEEP